MFFLARRSSLECRLGPLTCASIFFRFDGLRRQRQRHDDARYKIEELQNRNKTEAGTL